MLTPRPERKDAEVLLVTSENLNTGATVTKKIGSPTPRNYPPFFSRSPAEPLGKYHVH